MKRHIVVPYAMFFSKGAAARLHSEHWEKKPCSIYHAGLYLYKGNLLNLFPKSPIRHALPLQFFNP